MGLVARAIMRGELQDPFATNWLAHSNLWFFIQALSLRIFGDSIVGLRILSAVLGTLAVPALYFLARPLYGRVVAIIAAALLTGHHFHVHYSRIGLNNIADPTMMILALIAFFYGYNKRSLLGFAMAGVIMGFAQYFYFSARLIPLVILALLVCLALRDRRRLLELRRQIGIMGVGFILSAGPLLRYYLSHPVLFSSRLSEHGLLQNNNYVKLQVEGHSLFSALIALNDDGPFYNAGIPLLDHGMGVLFILSLVLLLLNWRKIEYVVLLLWVGAMGLIGGFLLWNYPQSQRYIISAPALCILISLALVQICLPPSQTGRLSRWLSMGVITATVFAIIVGNIFFYFGVYTPRNSYAASDAITEVANYLHSRAESRYVYMFTSPYFYLGHGTINFVGQNPAGIDIVDPLVSAVGLTDPTPGLKPVFIFVPERLSELEIVKQRYLNGQLQEYRFQPTNVRPSIYIYEPGN